jgi:hypothetical protein
MNSSFLPAFLSRKSKQGRGVMRGDGCRRRKLSDKTYGGNEFKFFLPTFSFKKK